ncbi:MAG: hypothetical protein EBX41_11285 [Chitinophagia bacterium]|nr:hypothetical protein [Chitinophagia bacterium]
MPAEVIEARTKVETLLQELDTLQPNTPANFETLVAKTSTIMVMLTHAYIVSDLVSKKTASILEALFTSYPKTFSAKKANPRVVNSLLNLFIGAINNAYLIGSDNEQKETYYIWANKVAHDLLKETNSITLDNCFGEYIWLPVTAANDETLEVSMEIAGTKDAFVCFSDDSIMVRNSGNEMYEIQLGAFDNKSMVMRLQSLGKAFKTIDKKEFPGGCLNPFKPTSITVSYKKGVISISDGSGKSTTWTDPYPVKGITWIGISSWESPITFDKIKVNKELISTSSKKTPATKAPEKSAASSKKEASKIAKKSSSNK